MTRWKYSTYIQQNTYKHRHVNTYTLLVCLHKLRHAPHPCFPHLPSGFETPKALHTATVLASEQSRFRVPMFWANVLGKHNSRRGFCSHSIFSPRFSIKVDRFFNERTSHTDRFFWRNGQFYLEDISPLRDLPTCRFR